MAGSEGGILPSMICFESEQGEAQPVSSLQRSLVAPLPSAENDRGYDKPTSKEDAVTYDVIWEEVPLSFAEKGFWFGLEAKICQNPVWCWFYSGG